MTAEIFNIQRFSLFDGPGVRTVVFLKGCPLRCLWCHNPEGLSPKKQIMYNMDRCMGCGACAEVCACHKMENGVHTYDRENCIACGKCTRECYSLALTQVGQTVTAEEVMETVLLDQGSYKATGDQLHKTLCGVPQRPILENLAMLNDLGAKVILRCPLIPDLNGTDEHLQDIAATANKFSCILEVQLEPYHRLGISKSGQLGVAPDYESQPPETEWTAAFAANLQQLCQIPVRIM